MGNKLGVDVSGSLIRVSATLSDEAGGGDANSSGHSDRATNRRRSMSHITYHEEILTQFLQHSPTWGVPWLLDLPDDGSQRRHRRVYCFLLDFGESEVFLTRAFTGMEEVMRRTMLSTSETCSSAGPHSFPIYITGSGATVFVKKAKEILKQYQASKSEVTLFNIDFRFQRELQSILRSLDFLLMKLPSLFFHYENTLQGVTDSGALPPATVFQPKLLQADEAESFYPYLLVNMKAGVSFHRVASATESVRVGGSPIGCATFVGLVRLLCGSASTPFDAFLFAQAGDQSTVDMLVKDIYGGDYGTIGLKGSIVASTLGKLQAIRPRSTVMDPAAGSDEPGHASIPLSAPRLDEFSAQKMNHEPKLLPPPGEPATSPESKLRSVMGLKVRDVLGEDSERLEGLSTEYASDYSDKPTPSREQLGRVASVPNLHLNDVRRCQLDSVSFRQPSEADVAKSLLSMMSFNVAQLAYFNAVLHKCRRIVFIGYYLELPDYLAAIQHCVDFWSQRQCQVHFIRVAPFLGSFGATLEKRYRQSTTNEDECVSAHETRAHS